ncbi:amino acid ABC transporter substrate-binding protein [Paenibacillus periandrae]|uniref:amino acid ABC transporter substrate-binding protein n=1 Tax=Paenibacillus periandrae TaxID=1761741 RepID=UPI001F092B78|nr:amino acid ABC transporter substrate-binding protein [Paenibacillus periandrae]
MKQLKAGMLLGILSMVILLVCACGKQAVVASQQGGQQVKVEEKVLRVGTSGRSLPMSYKNDKQQLDGYDVEVMLEIAKRIGYKVEWTTGEFSGLFGMLDADKIDTIANQVETSNQRKEKYLFSAPYVYSGSQLAVKKGNESIKSLEDLKGKKIAVGLGTNKEQFLRKFDTDKKVSMSIVTYEDPSGIVYDVANGRVDAYIVDGASGLIKIEVSGLPLELVGKPFEDYIIAHPFVKNEKNKELVELFNKAIEEMAKDGTLSKLSMKHLKQDVTKKK